MKAAMLCAFAATVWSSNETVWKKKQCTIPSTDGCKYFDENAKAHAGISASKCCAKCHANPACKGFSVQSQGFSEYCYIHTKSDLPKEEVPDFSCGLKPVSPTPPPAPTPPPGPFSGANWAVIVCGSSTFTNYRHQADACHAYQVVKKNGIPESNIILMMVDDVANDPANPYPGKLFNKATAAGTPAVDVHDGCTPDYKGADVTAENFLAVLTGDTAKVAGKGNGKVLKSTGTDNVFVNFIGHGGAELNYMVGLPLHAGDLNAALMQMHTSNMYRKLVFYMEACNSGSMFADILPKDINVFATTAANPSEPAWGTYCPPNDMVNGKNIGACLGDLYSLAWMEESELGEDKTLEAQYETVVKLTNASHPWLPTHKEYQHPQMYGDETWTSDIVGHYQGRGESNSTRKSAGRNAAAKDEFPKHAVDVSDIDLLQVFYKYLRADEHDDGTKMTPTELAAAVVKRTESAGELIKLVQRREADDALFATMLSSLAKAVATSNSAVESKTGSAAHFDCVKAVTASVQDQCDGFTSYSLKYHHLVMGYCSKIHQSEIIRTVTATCTPSISTEQ